MTKAGCFKLLIGFSFLLMPITGSGQSELLVKFQQYREKFQSSKKDQQIKKLQDIDKEIAKATEPNDIRLLKMAKAVLATEHGLDEIALVLWSELTSEKHHLLEYAHFYYGNVLKRNQKRSEAKEQFEKVLALKPNAKLQMDSQFQLAEILIEEKKFQEARSLLSKLEKRQRRTEEHPETIYALAKAEQGLKNQVGFCKQVRFLYTQHPQFSRIQNWGPQLSEDLFENKPTGCSIRSEDRRARIRNFQWAGLAERAFSEIESLRKVSSPAEKYEVDRLEVGYWLHEGEMDKALAILNPYYETRKNDISFLQLLASTNARAGDSKVAVENYYRIYNLNKRGAIGKQALYQAAFLSYQFRDYDGAAAKFTEFNKVYPGSGLSRDASWHLAWIQYLKADYAGAYSSLNKTLKEAQKRKRAWKSFPKDRVNYWMAMSLYRQGQLSQAKTMFEKLAQDKLISYYSVAAQNRLNKIQKELSQTNTGLASRSPLRSIARFAFVESVIPAEELGDFAEEDESEESLVIKTGAELTEGPEFSELNEETSNTVDGQNVLSEKPEENLEASSESKPSFANPVLVNKFIQARDLITLGLADWARWDLYEIEKKTSNREYLKTLMQEYESVENYHRSSYIAQVNFGGQRALHGIDGVKYLWQHAYPQAFAEHVKKYSSKYSVPQELIWGIMRAESHYKKSVISPVGALGLMQVMPSTGQRVAGILGEKKYHAPELLQPEYAVRIGGKYLQRLSRQFEGNTPLVAAAYNAGPHRVKNWLNNFGNLDVDEFIEHIPFLETRNYVKKVVSNYQIYSQLYANKKDAFSYLSEAIKVKIPKTVSTKETWEDI